MTLPNFKFPFNRMSFQKHIAAQGLETAAAALTLPEPGPSHIILNLSFVSLWSFEDWKRRVRYTQREGTNYH